MYNRKLGRTLFPLKNLNIFVLKPQLLLMSSFARCSTLLLHDQFLTQQHPHHTISRSLTMPATHRILRMDVIALILAALSVSSGVSAFVFYGFPLGSRLPLSSPNPTQQQPRTRQAISNKHYSSRTSSILVACALKVDENDSSHFDGWNLQPGTEIGTVSLIGAGPGDPDLLTVAGLRELKSADLVIADRLVSKEILGLVEGELRVARKYPGCAEQAQREIYRWMREGLSAGKHVVRLKIGDPFIFGRGAEEVLEMRRLGIEPKVVPGISSVFAAPLLGGVPATHRGVATQITLGTGYGQDYARPDICDYHPQKTAIFLMAIGRLEELCDDLVRRSYPTDCPVAIIENASTPRQRLIAGAVNSIVDIARGLNVKAPATIVVGEVVSVLHGRQQGLLSDASEGMFAGVDAKKVARAAKVVANRSKANGAEEGILAEKVSPTPAPLTGL